MRDYRSPLAATLEPYVGGEQPQGRRFIKLNTNESPYPPSPHVRAAVDSQIDLLNLYPTVTSEPVQEAAARAFGLMPAQVHVGNGSDEILALCFAAYFAGKTLYAPDLTYSFYPTFAQLFQVDYHEIPLREDFTVDVDAFLAAPGGIILANPNAPSSVALPISEIRRLCQAAHDRESVIIVDEAYAAFNTEDALSLIAEFDNLVVTRTMSKAHGLAGMRVGLALGQESIIQALADVKDSFNTYPVDRLACAAAVAALDDTAYLHKTVGMVVATRERTREALLRMGMEVLPSRTNFLLVRHPRVSGEEMQRRLRERDIIVRRFSNPRIRDYLRISIGTDAAMDAVLAVYRESL